MNKLSKKNKDYLFTTTLTPGEVKRIRMYLSLLNGVHPISITYDKIDGYLNDAISEYLYRTDCIINEYLNDKK